MIKIRPACVLLSFLCMTANAADSVHERLQTQTSFDIPAQALGISLKQLAEQAGVQILFEEDVVRGLTAPALNARHSIEDALRLLLTNTGLVYTASGDTIAVRKALRVPSESKTPSIESPALEHEDGRATADERIDLTAASGSQSTDALASGRAREDLEMIVVTGSRLKRVDTEGPSPVHVITRQDIDRSGAATVRELLNTIPQNGVTRDESGNGTYLGASTVQLRGLPLGTTLILLNGRRVGASGSQVSYNIFDLANVPLEAVERIEVLTDSASAVYGADAIGGAVNIILREGYEGGGGGVRYGTSAQGDADERQASFTMGGSGEALSGMIVLDYFERDLLHASDRELTSTNDFRRYGGEDLRSTWSYPGNVYSLDGSPLPGLTNSFAGIPNGTDGIGLTPVDFQATDGVLNLFDNAPYQTLLTGAERRSAFASAQYRFTDDLKLFVEGLYTHRDELVEFPPEPLPFGQIGYFTVPATNPFNPFGVNVGIDYRFVELGPRTYDTTNEFLRYVAGLSGRSGKFEWEIYWLGDRDEAEVLNGATLNSVFNVDLIQQYLNSTDPNVALNVFSTTGNNSRQTLAALLSGGVTTDNLATRASMGEAVVRGPVWDLPGGTLNAVLGVNVRREKVEFVSPLAGELRDDRNGKSVFAELAVPLVGPSQHVPAIHSLELTAAVRHDDYDDFDSSTEPQFGVAWRAVPSLLIRASYGEAYKAPTPFQLFLPRLMLSVSIADPARGDELREITMVAGGNPDLAPEQGTSTTLGFIWEPTFARGLTLSMNAFRVRQEDFITTLDPALLLENEALFPGRIVRAAPLPGDPPGTPGPIISLDVSNLNFGRVTTKGFDAELEYTFPPGAFGQLVASLYATYIDEFEILLTPGSVAVNRVDQANEAGYPLRFRSAASLTWNRGGWSAALKARYAGAYTDFDGVHELPAQTLMDLQIGRRFGDYGELWLFDDLETTLGVINLTDKQGHFSRSMTGYDYLQSDMRGRFYYLNLKARF